MKILFMGTPEFANYSLTALYDAGHEICGVVTQPDKKRGRGHHMAHPDVYIKAEQLGLNIYQPENLKKENFYEILEKTDPELIVVTAYGKILPEYVLEYPKYGCINVHGSLLPKYRGAAPMQWAIINGETKTGITVMYMEKGLDTGDMILKSECEITKDDTFLTLHDKMANISGNVLIKAIDDIYNGCAKREKQDDSYSCYSPMIDKETSRINFSLDAEKITNLIRALNPFPKAFTTYCGAQFKILSSDWANEKTNLCPGTVSDVGKDYFKVSCASDTVLIIKEIQPEGKRVMTVEDYLKGNKIEKGVILGK